MDLKAVLAAALSIGLFLTGHAAAQGDKPAEKHKKLAELVPLAIKEDPNADKLQLLYIQRHNQLVETLTELAKKLEDHRLHGDEFLFFIRAQKKLVDHELAINDRQRIAIIEQSLELAKGFERRHFATKDLDFPSYLSIARANRMEMEIRLEEAKRDAAKASPAK